MSSHVREKRKWKKMWTIVFHGSLLCLPFEISWMFFEWAMKLSLTIALESHMWNSLSRYLNDRIFCDTQNEDMLFNVSFDYDFFVFTRAYLMLFILFALLFLLRYILIKRFELSGFALASKSLGDIADDNVCFFHILLILIE